MYISELLLLLFVCLFVCCCFSPSCFFFVLIHALLATSLDLHCRKPDTCIEDFHGNHVGGLKQFCMKIDVISQGKENLLFLPSNMAAMTSHENALLSLFLQVKLDFCRRTEESMSPSLGHDDIWPS